MIADRWEDRAACKGLPASMFFPESGDSRAVREARRLCGSCPVLADCRAAHLGDRLGFVAGMTERERQRERRRLGWSAYPARPHVAGCGCLIHRRRVS